MHAWASSLPRLGRTLLPRTEAAAATRTRCPVWCKILAPGAPFLWQPCTPVMTATPSWEVTPCEGTPRFPELQESCSVQLQHVEGGGAPPSWDHILGAPVSRVPSAAKSASAEAILKHSVQDLIHGPHCGVEEDGGFGFVRDPCYLAGSGPRSLSCSERGGEEIPLFTYHPTPPGWSGSGCQWLLSS